ncbi:3-hydroxy-3-methylglutaryl-coenzyme A reductase-like isoform X2 [Palaemon carinicauda]|uniref:3-hydroxy-3-methylglutaryl-coenzyme A reductase-like isoform X2 n=1 Tax=Palaemon carinicauda TaxID=392227 RepID=UPI0035B695E4
MTIIRCSALLYTYHQFRKLHKIGSKYILGIAGLFAVFSSFVFSCSVIKLLDSDVSDLKDALFFFLLLVDLSKASLLAQFALTSSSQTEVHTNIACGMARLGPSLTLDTIVEALVIGAGTLSGVSRLEQMCAFACVSIVVNYIVFMTFFPACLSLVLELSNRCSSGQPPWQMATLARAMVEEERPNPVVQRVKVIMSAGLLLVHGITRWSLSLSANTMTLSDSAAAFNSSTDPHVIVRLLNAGLDHVVFMVLLVALIIKYVLFESQGHLEEHLIHDSLLTSQDDNQSPSLSGKVSVKKEDVSTQTEAISPAMENKEDEKPEFPPRSLDDCINIMNSEAGVKSLTNQEIVQLVEKKHVPGYKLETVLGDPLRAVDIRRRVVAPHTTAKSSMDTLPYDHYDYTKVMGVCCENVIGYVPVPVGVVGPLNVNGKKYMVPMATTEGCLVASTNRGCRALVGGVKCEVIRDGMTRAPSIRLPTAGRATEVYMWIRNKDNFNIIKEAFDSTSRFARLQDLRVAIAGRLLYTRFVAQTGDAMGMNMVSKGTEAALAAVKKYFPDLEILSVSGNYCVDKKPSAINWIEGRGKSVVCEAVIPGKVVTSILKTSVAALVDANVTKNLVGSSLAGSIGGNNAHAANIVAAVYIACGQDPAQVVGSSNCMTLMEAWGDNKEDLHMTVTMPSLEVGTVGGGTGLHPQSACLSMLGVKGAHRETPGENARQFAKIVAGTVLAGELSLMSALAAGHLVKSHMTHNRAKAPTTEATATAPVTSSATTVSPSNSAPALLATASSPASPLPSETLPQTCSVSASLENIASGGSSPSSVSDIKTGSEANKNECNPIINLPACKDPGNLNVPHTRDR